MYPESPFFAVEELPADFLRPGTERWSIRLGEVLFMFISFDRQTVFPPTITSGTASSTWTGGSLRSPFRRSCGVNG